MLNSDARTEPTLHDGGLRAMRSTSPTVVYLDLDTRQLLWHRRSTSAALP